MGAQRAIARAGLRAAVSVVLVGAALGLVACGGNGSSPSAPVDAAAAPSSEAPRRVFLVTIDTLRADHLGGPYGYPRGASPFLDDLMTRSTVFTDVAASSSHTGPCHASLFTGLQPAQHRLLQNGERLDPSLVTLAGLYREAGYRTAAFSAVGFLAGLRSGFEHFSSQPTYRPATDVLDDAHAWLAAQDPDARTFAWIHLFDVHEWYVPKHLDRAAIDELTAASSVAGDELLAFLEDQRGLRPGERFPAEKILDGIGRYDGQLLSTDRALAAFWKRIATTGPSEDSLWVITADHGEGLGEHGYAGHGRYLYEEQLRVPLIVHASDGRFAPAVQDAMVRQVDIGPTLAELVGASFADQPIAVAGRSLVPLLAGEATRWETSKAFAQRRPVDAKRIREGWEPGDVFTLRGPRFKAIAHSRGEHELFDLVADPHELTNLFAGSPSGEVATDDGRRLLRQAVQAYRRMVEEGLAAVGDDEIDPAHVEELRALGYL